MHICFCRCAFLFYIALPFTVTLPSIMIWPLFFMHILAFAVSRFISPSALTLISGSAPSGSLFLFISDSHMATPPM